MGFNKSTGERFCTMPPDEPVVAPAACAVPVILGSIMVVDSGIPLGLDTY
jgi:hypothetical protein